MNPNTELPKTYAPSEFEDRIYQNWVEKGYFTPDPASTAPSFSVVIPPPNVTGQLHMGHALDETLQDILVRTKRMHTAPAMSSMASPTARTEFMFSSFMIFSIETVLSLLKCVVFGFLCSVLLIIYPFRGGFTHQA